MAHNLIVTCGTSQCIPPKLDNLPGDKGYNDYFCPPAADRDIVPQGGYFETLSNDPMLSEYARVVVDNYWPARAEQVGQRDNPFGAEITTLVAMETGTHWQPDPGGDRVALLASQTGAGVWCAAAVGELIRQGWGMQGIYPKIVPGLTQNPADPAATTRDLALTLRDEIRAGSAQGLINVLVMSGGFKSLIPCMTIFSLVFGINMYYLFEHSTQLQSLHALLVDTQGEENLKFWEKTWQRMQRQHWAVDKNHCLRIAMTTRLEEEGVHF